jgi:hypothetical protein
LYAAIGVALGTFTGMAAALVSLQPQTAMAASHLSFVSSHASAFHIHPIANAGQTPVIQNHASAPSAIAAQPRVLEAKAVAPAAPLAKPARMETFAVPPAATLKIAAVEPAPIKIPVVHKHVLTGKLTLAPASVLGGNAPAPNLNSLSASAAGPAATPAAAPVDASINFDGGAKQQVQMFYSEGDVTVADYNAARDTIETEDGRTFVIGATVSVSTATSWDDYRANVHYRCDGNGNCSLARTGVIALNAHAI